MSEQAKLVIVSTTLAVDQCHTVVNLSRLVKADRSRSPQRLRGGEVSAGDAAGSSLCRVLRADVGEPLLVPLSCGDTGALKLKRVQ